jgi:ubiquinone/menaquinone biosynthesis C-methylase UbiE
LPRAGALRILAAQTPRRVGRGLAAEGMCDVTTASYIIRGGVSGFERLRVLSRVLHPTTGALFDRIGVAADMHCLDVGCGSGDVSLELSRRVGASGRVLGVDLDEVKLELARSTADACGARGLEFRKADVLALPPHPEFDLIYVRFVLTHLTDPGAALAGLVRLLRPNGILAVEDIDMRGCFCHPPSDAHRRQAELYTRAAEAKGGDANIGPRLPELLRAAGLSHVQVGVVQPTALTGETKLIALLTMQNIADAVITGGHASVQEVDAIVSELAALAADSTTLIALPRIFQTWGFYEGSREHD